MIVVFQSFLSLLDFPTLSLVFSATAILSFVAMLVLWLLNPSEKGPPFWAAACLCISLVVLVRPFFEFLGPFTFIHVIGFPLALSLGFEGLMRFRGLGGENARKHFFAVFFLFFTFTSYAAGNHAGLRSLLHDGFMVVILLFAAFTMVRGTRGIELLVNAISALGCLVLAAALAYQWSLAFAGLIGEQIHASSKLVYFAAILWMLTTWSFGASMAVMLRARQHIVRLADYDTLTNLPNRRNYDRHLDSLLTGKNGGRKTFSIVIVDLNGLKHINDFYGHAFGDMALILTAEALGRAVGQEQMASRFGGDEFVLLDRSATDWSDVKNFEMRIRDLVEREHPLHDGGKIRLRISLGSALFPEDGTRAGDLFRAADQRMYLEKQMRHTLSEVMRP